MHVNLKNNTGKLVQAKIGFSWTVFFFVFFVPIVRGDGKGFLFMFLTCLLTMGLSNFVWIFIYNNWYIKNQLAKGYKPADSMSMDMLKAKGWISA